MKRVLKKTSKGHAQHYWVGKPPAAAKEAAMKALRWKKEHPDEVKAMTPVGWARARQLARGDKLSLNTVQRMARFERHRSNAKINPKFKARPWKDRGHVAWLGWGGDEGIAWAKRKANETKDPEA